MAEATQRVRVSFRKQVSDGNYGTEAAEASIELEVKDVGEAEDVEDMLKVLEDLLKEMRQRVHAELLRSPSPAVRRAVEPRPALAGVATEPDLDDPDLPF
jgi:hypothetical protein